MSVLPVSNFQYKLVSEFKESQLSFCKILDTGAENGHTSGLAMLGLLTAKTCVVCHQAQVTTTIIT